MRADVILRGCEMAGKATGAGAEVQGCAAVTAKCKVRPSVRISSPVFASSAGSEKGVLCAGSSWMTFLGA